MTNPLYDRLFGRHAGSKKAFLLLPDEREVTYSAYLDLGSQIAGHLTSIGLRPGNRVAVQAEKSAEMLALVAACAQAGLILLPLNTAYTADELIYFVEDADAKLFVGAKGIAETISRRVSIKFETLEADGSGSLMAGASAQGTAFETVPRSEDDLAAFLYTSGTTGRSKGAMLSQGNLLSNAEALTECWQFTSDDVLLHALPIFHTHGLFVATNVMLMAGGSMIFLPKFDLDQMLKQMPKATTMMGVPTFYTRLLGDARFTKDLTSHMRLFISGSAPLLADTHIEFEDRTGHRILERYGMTETNMNTSNPYEGARKAGTVGLPLPGVDVKITNPETGEVLPNGEIGVLEVRGPNVFQGYWNMPEKTAEEMRPDGFFITGDLARIDEDGYVQIVGRGKDLIISGGYNIYPKEIELVLDEQAGVLESAVIGAPHPDFGESVLAVLVAEGDGPDIEAIRANLTECLARFKHPRQFEIVEALPRNTMGKVQKNVLRDEFNAVFQT